jgi:hypothetical protein
VIFHDIALVFMEEGLGDIGLLTVSEGERKMMEPVKGSHRMILFSYGNGESLVLWFLCDSG